jgi:hypothetical protein
MDVHTPYDEGDEERDKVTGMQRRNEMWSFYQAIGGIMTEVSYDFNRYTISFHIKIEGGGKWT